jgi:hypothetical protein
MIRIAISPTAYAAVAGTLPDSIGVERERAKNGDIYIWLAPDLLSKLKTMRGPSDDYSAVILRLAGRGELGAS